MNKILEKFGIYDLIAVLLSGISICTLSLLVMQLIYEQNINIEIQMNETLSFLVISYFIGLIFQECGSLMQKIKYKNNALLKSALKVSDNSHILLTEYEKNSVYTYIKSKLSLKEDNDNIVYNYCKYYVMKNCDTTRIDKEQSISAMSRSLCLYFLILLMIALITLFYIPNWRTVVLVAISFLLFIIFYNRYIRFVKMRYISMIRMFYYDILMRDV